MIKHKFRYGTRYNYRLSGLVYYIKTAIRSRKYFIKSFLKNEKLKDEEITAIMCVWDEQENIKYAIESSKDFVSKYIVVDKNGETIPEIRILQQKYNLNIDYYTKPYLNLRESRLFALNKVDAKWVLILDGDEVLHTDGEYNIINLKKLMVYPNLIFRTRMNVYLKDKYHTRSIQNSYHVFLFYNNKTTYFVKNRDIPNLKGRVINLKGIYKHNLYGLKNKKRLYYRQNFWLDYEKSGLQSKFSSIEEYVKKYKEINVTDETIDNWYECYTQNILPYDEKLLGYKPKVLRE